MRFFLQKSWRLFFKAITYSNIFLIICSHYYRSKATRRARQAEPGRWIFQPCHLTWRALVYSAATNKIRIYTNFKTTDYKFFDYCTLDIWSSITSTLEQLLKLRCTYSAANYSTHEMEQEKHKIYAQDTFRHVFKWLTAERSIVHIHDGKLELRRRIFVQMNNLDLRDT